jgi:hypothetical protein
MPAIEQLPYTVEVWTDDGNHLVDSLARASHHAVAVAAYWAATTARPRAYVMLRNRAMVLSERPASLAPGPS